MQDQMDVLIVGAGPVGLTLANELARRNVSFAIIDRRESRSETSRAIYIHARTLEILESLGLADEFVQRGVKIEKVNAYAGEKQILDVALDSIDSPFQFALALPQSTTEEILETHLRNNRATIQREVELLSLNDRPNGVECQLSHGDEEKTVYARYVVACDGAHSTVRTQVGAQFEGSSTEQNFALVDGDLESQLAPDELHLFLSAPGPVVISPVGDGQTRIICDLLATQPEHLTAEYIQRLCQERGVPKLKVKNPTWFSTFRIHHRLIDNYRNGNVFFAGDAAHIHSPAGGQGMNIGVQDVHNLAWKLALHLRGGIDLLNTYNMERRPVGADVIEMTDRLNRVCTSANPVITTIRDRLVPFFAGIDVIQKRMVRRLEEVDVRYSRSPLIDEHFGEVRNSSRFPFSNGPQPGERGPDGTITHALTGNARRIFELLPGTMHTLLIFTHAGAQASRLRAIKRLLELCETTFQGFAQALLVTGRQAPSEFEKYQHLVYLDPRQTIHVKYGVYHATSLYFIRPDGYIGFRSMPLDTDAFLDYIQRVYSPALVNEPSRNAR